MRFTINAKEFKTLVDKATSLTPKKPSLQALHRLYFTVMDSILTVETTDCEQYLYIECKDVWNAEKGKIGIDLDEIKQLIKMKDVMEFTVNNDTTVTVKCGKKQLTIPAYEYNDVATLPDIKDRKNVFCVRENWLYETFLNLNKFTSDNEKQKMMQVLNMTPTRVSTIDGCRIGMRDFSGIVMEYTEDVNIYNKFIPIMKKVIDKKSNSDVTIATTEKHIVIETEAMIYVQYKVEGQFFDIDKIINLDCNYNVKANAKELLEVMKYDVDIVKEHKKPVIIHPTKETTFVLAKAKYEALDQVETELIGNEDLYIGFNPQFFVDSLEIVDDEITMELSTSKAPMLMKANDYQFLILPVNLSDSITDEIINKMIVA